MDTFPFLKKIWACPPPVEAAAILVKIQSAIIVFSQ
jgi:hypothetical protein